MKAKAYLNWSGGKDAMLALHTLKSEHRCSVKKLLTTVNAANNRVSMHGVPTVLMQAQATRLGLPLKVLSLPQEAAIETYNLMMENAVDALKKEGYTHSVFGDILLEDLKSYREEQLKPYAIEAVFPLWKKDTKTLVNRFIELGYKAVVVCVNAKWLDRSFCGRLIDKDFLNDLPTNVDPCGENGEFHSFVYDGPLFQQPVSFSLGEVVQHDYRPSANNKNDDCFMTPRGWDTQFWFQDLIPN